MKLCLDEHFPPQIAEQLRRRGHDVIAVKERADLRGSGDRELLARMAEERRALVTENVADFVPLLREAAAAGDDHSGVILTPARSLPSTRAAIGAFVERLDELLRARPAGDALRNRAHSLGS